MEHGKEDLLSPAAILYTMTTCHSLKLVNDEIIGDPLDAKMFEFTGWTFEEGGRVYEFMRDQDDKEGDDVELLDKDEPPTGHYVARDGSERSGMPSVRPPASEERVYGTLNLLIEGWFGIATSTNFRV
jgi:hypothetical protein